MFSFFNSEGWAKTIQGINLMKISYQLYQYSQNPEGELANLSLDLINTLSTVFILRDKPDLLEFMAASMLNTFAMGSFGQAMFSPSSSYSTTENVVGFALCLVNIFALASNGEKKEETKKEEVKIDFAPKG